MGSTFGKVRKYNVNHSGEPNAYRYNVGMDEVGKPLEFTQPSVKGDLKESFSKGSVQERPRFYHPKGEESDHPIPMFSTAYSPPSHTEEYGLRFTEDLLIPPNLSFTSGKKEKDPVRRSYEFSEQELQAAIENVLRTTAFGSTVPSERFRSTKPDSAMDLNPKPYQKVYSAEDIYKLLRPLNILNSKLNSIQPHQSFRDQEPNKYSKHASSVKPQTLYSVPHKCCNHQESGIGSQLIEVTKYPPPYSDSSPGVNIHGSRISSSSQHSLQYSTENREQSRQTNSSHLIFTPNLKYNTIHNDGRIPLHLRQEFNTFSNSRSRPSSPEPKNRTHETGRVLSSDNIHEFTNSQKPTHKTSKNQDIDFKKFRRHSDFLRRTAFFDKTPHVQPRLHNSPLSNTHYTIPEGRAWPPPFGHNSMQSASFRSSY